jgi:predicted DNA-binding ribbon-helix-helix protein
VAEDRESDDESSSGRDSYLVSRYVFICGRRTSVRLEDEMWTAFKDVAERGGYTIHDLAGHMHRGKKPGQTFTSAIRVFLMLYYRNAARAESHAKTW